MDLVGTAFGIALDEEFSDKELEKLGQWREEVRDREEGAPRKDS